MNSAGDFMIEFIESPIYDNWLAKNKPTKSLLICTPYMKQGALNRIFDKYALEDQGRTLDIKVLIRGNTEEFTHNRSSDITILDTFVTLDGFNISNFRRIGNLHMKAYLIDEEKLLITSGNLTNSGMFSIQMTENFEGGIATDESSIISSFLAYFQRIWDQSEGLDSFYDEIVNAYTTYATDAKNTTRKPRKKKKYLFPSVQVSTSATSPSSSKFVPSDLPPARIDTLLATLNILAQSPTPLTMMDLGKKLRTNLPNADLTDNVSNQKYGEEKGGLALYFGLAHRLKNGSSYQYMINTMGKRYLNFSVSERHSYIVEQTQMKEALCDIIEHCQDSGFELKKYIFTHCDGMESTLTRKVSPVKRILALYNNGDTTGL